MLMWRQANVLSSDHGFHWKKHKIAIDATSHWHEMLKTPLVSWCSAVKLPTERETGRQTAAQNYNLLIIRNSLIQSLNCFKKFKCLGSVVYQNYEVIASHKKRVSFFDNCKRGTFCFLATITEGLFKVLMADCVNFCVHVRVCSVFCFYVKEIQSFNVFMLTLHLWHH